MCLQGGCGKYLVPVMGRGGKLAKGVERVKEKAGGRMRARLSSRKVQSRQVERGEDVRSMA